MTKLHSLPALLKRSAFTQGELAQLLAISQTRISRLEDGHPSLGTALALQVVFDVEPRLVFPQLYEQVEDAVMRRAAELDKRLAGKNDPKSLRKKASLARMVRPQKTASAT